MALFFYTLIRQQPSPSNPSSLQTALSSPSRADCPVPNPRPGRARRAAWGVRADPKRGHQREHGGRGWADRAGRTA